MSKKIILIVLSVGILGYLGFKFFIDGMNKPCSPPDRPTGLPSTAEWFGGCDGGNWIELLSLDDGKYHFKIYRDWDGVLVMDADFVLEGCNGLTLTADSWKKLITYYNQEDSFAVLAVNGKPGCRLKSLYPAYGGEDWKTLQDK